MIIKKCNRCGEEKFIDEFYACHKVFSPDGRLPQCKKCKLEGREKKVVIPLDDWGAVLL